MTIRVRTAVLLILAPLATKLPAQVWEVRNQLLTPDGGPIPLASFGSALASGNFDGDGATDLAVAEPDADTSSFAGAGQVGAFYSSATGLHAGALAPIEGFEAHLRFGTPLAADFTQDSSGVPGLAESYDHFGSTLAVGDFNGDGDDDLAIGACNEDVGSVQGAGAVELTQASFDPLHNTAPETSDRFGTSLLVGPIGGSGAADIAVGTQYEALEGVGDAGCVHLLLGGNSPLASGLAQFFTERTELRASPAFAEDVFGVALAAGDFDHDGWRDLAIGIPGRDFPAADGAGAVEILYGAEFADGFGVGNESAWSSHVP